jgi:allantoicase
MSVRMLDESPSPFADSVDLASEVTGGFVIAATDDFFAEKEALVKASEPLFVADKYTDKGKWMDGWESQRRRNEGHDWALVRLGTPGVLDGVVVDTTHFRGNAPSEIQLEGIDAEANPLADLLDDAGYEVVIARVRVQPNTKNSFTLDGLKRFTHVKLRIYPDGGVARLRVYGRVVPNPAIFFRAGALDLAAVENGGRVVQVSDRFFGPPSNMLLPGRGVNMGDGWETARRRTPGTDWAVVQLGRPGVIETISLDTHFFKGNAPHAVTIEGSEDGVAFQPLLSKTPLSPHMRHTFTPDRRRVVSHVRVHIHPHGGVNRLRLFGVAKDDAPTQSRLRELDREGGRDVLLRMNGSSAWAAAMLSRRPFASARALLVAAEEAWWGLGEAAWLEAFSAHPKIGVKTAEQAQAVQDAQRGTLAKLDELNADYVKAHGFIFIVSAAGKSALEMLALLHERIGKDRATEIETAAAEQMKITRLRIERWLLEGA